MLALEDVLNDLAERLQTVEEAQQNKLMSRTGDFTHSDRHREPGKSNDAEESSPSSALGAEGDGNDASAESGRGQGGDGQLQQKVEHLQMDVNVIRDFLYNKEGHGKIDPSKLDPIRLLRSDLEGLRVALRRVEAAQLVAKEAQQSAPSALAMPNPGAFLQSMLSMDHLGKGSRQYPLDALNERASAPLDGGVLKAGDAMGNGSQSEELNQLKTEVEEITQAMLRNEHFVKTGLIELDAHLRAFVANNVQSSVGELANRTQTELSDLSENVRLLTKKGDATHAIADVLWRKMNHSSMKSGLALVASSLFSWRKRIMHHAFQHWKCSDVRDAREKGESLQSAMLRLHRILSQRRAFLRWTKKTQLLRDRDRLMNYTASIIRKWRYISIPNLQQCFTLWKRNTSYIHYLVLENAARKDRASEFSREPLGTLGEVMRQLGTDADGKLLLLATYASSSALRIERLGNAVRQSDSQIKDFGHHLKAQSKEILSVLNDRCESIEAGVKFFKTSITDATDKNSRAIEGIRDEMAGLLGGAAGATAKLEARMQMLEQLVSDQNKKISDLLALNGDLVHRLSVSNQANEKYEAAFLQIRAQIATLETNSSKSVASLQREVSVLKDNGTYLDSTVSQVKALVDDFADEINNIASAQQKFIESGLKAAEKGELGRFKGGQALAPSSGRVPSAKDLADLYSSFEHKVFELRSTDQFLMLVRAITEELACELAYLAHRLASHIALAADIELMAAKIRHHRSPDPVKMSVNAPVIDETRSAVAVRDSFLFAFMDEFNALVDAMPPCPLSVRTDARALFARRFLSIFDLALKKLSPVIRNLGPSTDPASASPHAATTSFSDDDAVMGAAATPSAMSSPRGDPVDSTPPRIGHNDYYMHKTKGAPTAAGALRPLLLSKSQQLDIGGPHSLPLTLHAQRPRTASGEGSRKAALVHHSGLQNKADSSNPAHIVEGGVSISVGRPRTAGSSRHRSAINDAVAGETTSRFVLRAGFRMPSGATESASVVHSVLHSTAAASAGPVEGISPAAHVGDKDVAAEVAQVPTRRPGVTKNE
jgi:hypothetical protein